MSETGWDFDAPSKTLNKNNYKTSKVTRFASWNVRTMLLGISNSTPSSTDDIPELRKTTIIDRELLRLRVDVAALQETRLLDEGSLREDNYTFFWKGKDDGERREHGVGFAVHNSLLRCTETPICVSERIMVLRLMSESGPISLVSAYAPTLKASDDVKDKFYEDLRECLEKVRASDKLLLLGDFNARVGNKSDNWPECIGHHGIGNINDNGQRLLELCASLSLCITNTYFQNKSIHKVSWKHPRSGHWHQIDFIITKRTDLRDILNSRTYHSADCNTDHSLIMAKTRLTPKKIHSARKAPRKVALNTAAMQDKALYKDLEKLIEEKLSKESLEQTTSAEDMWQLVKKEITQTAEKVFGKKERTVRDWFADYEHILLPVIEKKRIAHTNLLNNHRDPAKTHAYKAAKAEVQRVSRSCANEYWVKLCQSIQQCKDVGDFRGMYQGIKSAIGPTKRKRAAIKDLDGNPIADKREELSRWAQHYTNLYSQEVAIRPDALANLTPRTVATELDVPPKGDEFIKALQSLKLGKSTGSDNLPAELIRLGCVSSPLYALLLRCWDEGTVPQEMRDADIVTLYKGKGDRGDCNSYRGISLLSIVGKAFAKVVLRRLETLASQIYPESQCGFRAGRSTNDMIFTLRQLQEKSREHCLPLYMAFVDLNKAFDTVSREGLYEVLSKIGCPPKLLSIIRSFHDTMNGSVIFDGEKSEPFAVNRGVRQGCVLAPTLFGIFFSALLLTAFENCDVGVHLHTRKDGRLFNISLLKSKRKRQDLIARELLYADDAALVANSESELQELVTRFGNACHMFSMSVNTKKTVIMVQGVDQPPKISLDGAVLEVVDHFCYLGSTTTSSLSNDREIDTRIGKASTTFGRLFARVWRNRKLTTNTKVLVYQTCVLSILLYASETWTSYAKQERKLNAFHMRCLRTILGVTWKDKMSNEAVLTMTHCCSITAMLKQRRLRWLGHVHRMAPERLPRQVMLSEIADVKRPVGRPILRFKDACKRDMNSFGIQIDGWEERADMRPEWRHDVKVGMSKHDEDWLDNLKQKKLRRDLPPPIHSCFVCDRCGKKCRAAIGLYSHQRRCGNP
ncbi:hypothetical protein JYU34_011506 [Plutella xylostella]|uniref:Reverse transcriptase domain-containing protein n=1 Tax=Plutella xylostella TaxID=51655 RepID=A0ABQ7QH47_PLUXY|nr:hypothetical protein JYU34_011506 [Plutella xylostella]